MLAQNQNIRISRKYKSEQWKNIVLFDQTIDRIRPEYKQH